MKSSKFNLACYFLLIIMSSFFMGDAYAEFQYSDGNGVIAYCYQPVSGSYTKKIFRINEDGTGNVQIGNLAVSVNSPRLSPNGQKIVLYGYPNSSTWSIYLMNSDGSNLERLTNTEGVWDNCPAFSPDGQKIAFVRTYPSLSGKEEIWIMDSDGNNKIYSGILGGGVRWSPDGSKFIYHSNPGNNYDIYISNIDGTSETRLTTSASLDLQPSWSPDGSKVAFISDRDGNYEIYIINSDGSGLTRLTNNSADEFTPTWSPDGTRIAFESNLANIAANHSEIYVINSDGSNLKRITNTSSDATAINPDWYPDGYTDIESSTGNLPQSFYLFQNYPNPFNPTTTIKYEIPKSGFVSLKVFDILGNEVASLVNGEKSAGNYQVHLNASTLSSGIYLYRLQTGGYSMIKKMMLIK